MKTVFYFLFMTILAGCGLEFSKKWEPHVPSAGESSENSDTTAPLPPEDTPADADPSPGNDESTKEDNDATGNNIASSDQENSSPNQEKMEDDTVNILTDESGLDTPILPPEKNNFYFSEVVTDPQRDWNDSAGGNSLPFDALFGSGTIGTTDEWVEIVNGSSSIANIVGWKLEMQDGTDETYVFAADNITNLFFSMAGDVLHVSPQELVVIGNPPGDMKNSVQLNLWDDENNLVDELFVEDANANSTDDESFSLDENNDWIMGFSSPGF